jgi:hypothetical protein
MMMTVRGIAVMCCGESVLLVILLMMTTYLFYLYSIVIPVVFEEVLTDDIY